MLAISQEVKRQAVITFWVREDDNSPYQGVLFYDAIAYDALSADQVQADQLAQFNAWRTNLAAAQAAAEAAANAVPAQVTSIQARRAILAAGLQDAVEALIGQADQATQDLWYTTDIVERTNPVMLGLAAQLGLSSDQLDELFRQAARL